jgi:hypothetical protein
VGNRSRVYRALLLLLLIKNFEIEILLIVRIIGVSLIKEIVKHKNYQRQLIKDKYMTLYNTVSFLFCFLNSLLHISIMLYLPIYITKRLEEDIQSETRGNFAKCLCALLQPIDEFEAECLMEAIGTDNQVLIEIICSKEAHEIEVLNAAFNRSK